MPPRRAKASTQASTDVDMADADDASHALGSIALELASARSKLQDAVDRARDLNHVDLPPESELKVTDLLDYARRISYTTFAPPGYTPGAPLNGIMPPAPQEEHFTVSHLARHAAEVKLRAKELASAEEARLREEERRRAVEEAAKLTPEELIAKLSTWKPGEPWPSGIPPPPPGWKPGDPLHFDLPKPAREGGDIGMVKPTSTLAQQKAPQRIVPFVSLDLNPDLEDDDVDDDVGSIDDDFEEVSGSDASDSD